MSARHALQSARIAPRTPQTCSTGLSVSKYMAFCRKVLVRREKLAKVRKIDKHTYTYGLPSILTPFSSKLYIGTTQDRAIPEGGRSCSTRCAAAASAAAAAVGGAKCCCWAIYCKLPDNSSETSADSNLRIVCVFFVFYLS